MRRIITALFAVSFGLSATAFAEVSPEEVSELREDVQQLTALVQDLRQTVQQLRQTASSAAPAAGTSAVSATEGGYGSPTRVPSVASSLSAFNPEIGVLADIVGQFSESSADGEGNDKLSAREVELVFGHPIDPYSRLDITATFSDFEAASLEEAYITHWGLPGEIKARLGRLRPKVGKASPLHRDSLDTVDEPLVVANYLGAEGLARTGVELSGFVPLPWTAVTHELTAGAMEGGVGEGGTLFGSVRRRPSYYAHLKNFWDISDMTNAELGATYLTGSRDDDADLEVQALGLDGTLVHHLTANSRVKWQNELYLQERDEALSVDDLGTETLFSDSPWGWYSLLDWRLNPQWGVGGRFDHVEPVDVDPAILVRDADTAWSGYLTFYQSEFARWRLQFRHTNYALGGDDNTLYLQGTVAIGVHKHQIQ